MAVYAQSPASKEKMLAMARGWDAQAEAYDAVI
jgi:hypothetical protein